MHQHMGIALLSLLCVTAARGIANRPMLTNPEVENLQEIKILSPVPLSGGWIGGHTMRVAGEIAKDIINSQQHMLPGYYLTVDWMDDKCNPDYGVEVMLESWMNDTSYVALGANGCSAVCMSVAIVAQKIRIPHVSYGCASGSISNTVKYPTLSRMMTVENAMADVFEALGNEWGWKEIHIITGSPARFDAPAQYLLDHFEYRRMNAKWLTPRNPNWADTLKLMQTVRNSQQRVLVVLGYEPFYRKVVCAAVKVGIPKGIVWLSVGWHKSGWWAEYDAEMMDPISGFAPECTPDMISEYYEGAISAAGHGEPAVEDMDNSLPCFKDFTARSLRAILINHSLNTGPGGGYPLGENQLPGQPYWEILPYAADGMCIWAFMIRHMIFDLGFSLSDLQRPSVQVFDEMIRYIKTDLSFFGTSGQVRFEGNDKPGILAVFQVQRSANDLLEKKHVATVSLQNVLKQVPGASYKFADRSTGPESVFKSCPPGEVMDGNGDCEKCGVGKYHDCNEIGGQCTGSTNCIPCPRAYKNAGSGGIDLSACVPCNAGSYGDTLGASECQNCSIGRHGVSFGLTECSKCLQGKYAEKGGLSDCEDCSIGKFTNASGATSCLSCMSTMMGSTTATFGSIDYSACDTCEAGSFTNGLDKCHRCPHGTFAEQPGQTSCQPCAHGMATRQQGSTQCEYTWYYSSCAFGLWLFVFLSLMAVCRSFQHTIMIDDIDMEGDMLVITTVKKHRIPSTRGKVPIVLRDTGHSSLIGHFKVKVLSPSRLELLEANGQRKARCDSSSGQLRLVFPWNLRGTIYCIPAWLAAFALLVAAVGCMIIGRLTAELAAFALGAGVVASGMVSFGVRFLMLRLVNKSTPLQYQIESFKFLVKSRERNPPEAREEDRSSSFPSTSESSKEDHRQFDLERLFRSLTRQLTFERIRSSYSESRSVGKGAGRAISFGQLKDFYTFFASRIRDRNMYYVVAHIIKKITEESKLSYAELAGPFEVDWFVSHYWGDAFASLLSSIEEHARDSQYWDISDVPIRSRAYWVCSFSNNQWKVAEELGSHWTQASFFLALKSGTCRGTLIVMDHFVWPLSRSWCLFELAQTFEIKRNDDRAHYFGLVFGTEGGVVNSGRAPIGTAMALAHRVADIDLSDATTTSEADKQMIDDYVRNEMGGFCLMNEFIKAETRAALMACHSNFEGEFKSLLNKLPSSSELEISGMFTGSTSDANEAPPERDSNIGHHLVAKALLYL